MDEPLNPYDSSELDADDLTSVSSPTAANSASALQFGDNPLNLDDNGKPLTYKTAVLGFNSEHWVVAGSIELRRLIAKTKTMHPIHHHDLPSDRRGDVTYYNPTTKEKLINGRRTSRVRGLAGGDRINYSGIVSSSTASLKLVKVLLHSVVSDNADCITIDIDDFFLLSTLPRSEYLRISVAVLPDDIREEFHLDQYIHNDYVLFEVTKGMYGLPQAG